MEAIPQHFSWTSTFAKAADVGVSVFAMGCRRVCTVLANPRKIALIVMLLALPILAEAVVDPQSPSAAIFTRAHETIAHEGMELLCRVTPFHYQFGHPAHQCTWIRVGDRYLADVSFENIPLIDKVVSYLQQFSSLNATSMPFGDRKAWERCKADNKEVIAVQVRQGVEWMWAWMCTHEPGNVFDNYSFNA